MRKIKPYKRLNCKNYSILYANYARSGVPRNFRKMGHFPAKLSWPLGNNEQLKNSVGYIFLNKLRSKKADLNLGGCGLVFYSNMIASHIHTLARKFEVRIIQNSKIRKISSSRTEFSISTLLKFPG